MIAAMIMTLSLQLLLCTCNIYLTHAQSKVQNADFTEYVEKSSQIKD